MNRMISKQSTFDINDKEAVQKRHYFLLSELQKMVKEIKNKEHQKRFNYELLTALSGSLIDGTVFEIVRGLAEIQQISEKNLYNERVKILNEYISQRDRLVKRHREAEQNCQTRPHHLPILQAANKRELEAYDKRMNEELHRYDIKTVLELDQKVLEQQETMKKAGVCGFYVSTDPNETKIQMYIFEFIQRLSKISMKN